MKTAELIRKAYEAFNSRDINGAVKLMAKTVSWPKASEGGRVVGPDEVRAYWSRQWEAFDPHVEPVEIGDCDEGTTKVKVHQVVKDLKGNLLSDSFVFHHYTIKNGLIERMDIPEDQNGSNEKPSTAFSQHGR